MSENTVPAIDRRRWVMIESGSNQEFIFQSTKRRFQVGASALLKDLAEWVREAVSATAAGQSVTTVVRTSSKALLLVDEPAVGQRIVEKVTKRALTDAPGLDVWGYVESEEPEGPPMGRIQQLHAEHGLARWGRPGPKQRFGVQPFLETCDITGLPATTTIAEPGSDQPATASATTAAVFDRATSAHKELQSLCGDAVLADLSAEISNAGWVAVAHADGNGIGNVIQKVADIDEFTAFSSALLEATSTAFASAVSTVTDRTDWLVPLIIGGDDVTFVCDGRVALAVVRAYLQAFERETSMGVLAEAAQRAGGVGHLTASAGVAFVKPHFPFHAAYRLADQLASEAKQVKERALGRSAYDFHVLHDSISRPLAQIRDGLRHQGSRDRLWPGPFVTPAATEGAKDGPWCIDHADSLLLDTVTELQSDRDERLLSGSALHDLRAGLLAGEPELSRTTTRLLAAHPRRADAEDFLKRQVFTEGDTSVNRLIAVIDAADMAAGVLAVERPSGPKRRKKKPLGDSGKARQHAGRSMR